MRLFFLVLVSAAGAVAIVSSCGRDDAEATRSPTDAGTVDGGPGTYVPPIDGGDAGGPSDAGAEDVNVPLVSSCKADAGAYPSTWLADPKLCLTLFASSLPYVRQLAFAPNGDLFVETNGFLYALFDTNGDGVIGNGERSKFAEVAAGLVSLSHGVVFSPDNAFVYASSDTTVYRWGYKSGDRVASGPEQIVVANMPSAGHPTRTLVFDSQGRLNVTIGSFGDVDTQAQLLSTRSMIRRFVLPLTLPPAGIDFATGEVYGSGMRNEVGLTFDSKGRMWGVENGSDGVDEDNPAEELNRVDAPGVRFFGYPYCWSEFKLASGGMGPGTQWSYGNGQTDSWCRDPANVQKPAAVMQGHWAPLGIAEYTGGSLPWKGDLFITAHGSYLRPVPVGRLIARAHLKGDTVESITPIAGHLVDGGLEQGTWEVRPVDVKTGPDGALYFSDDKGSQILRLGYAP